MNEPVRDDRRITLTTHLGFTDLTSLIMLSKVSSINHAPKQRTRPCPRSFRPSNPAPRAMQTPAAEDWHMWIPPARPVGQRDTACIGLDDNQQRPGLASTCAGTGGHHQHGWQSSTTPLTSAWTTFSIRGLQSNGGDDARTHTTAQRQGGQAFGALFITSAPT